MTTPDAVEQSAELRAENIGGIDETTVAFDPGVTVLAGRNATNRTSLLYAILAGLGSDTVSLKGDADEGHVELTLGDETYTRTLERTPEGVVTGGNPLLSDPELADRFAFLLEANDARRAVARGDDLRDIIMRPVDTDALEAEIRELQAEREQVDDELADLDDLESRLAELRSERETLDEEIQAARDELAEAEAELAAFEEDVDETRDAKAELDAKLDELSDLRNEREAVERDIRSTDSSIEALESERERVQAERETLPEEPQEELEAVEAEIETLRTRKQSIESTVSDLQTVIQFNEDVLDGSSAEVAAALQRTRNGGTVDASAPDSTAGDSETDIDDVTAGLLPDDSEPLGPGDDVVCWTCGTPVDREQLDGTLETLRSLRKEQLDAQRSVAEQLEEYRNRRRELESVRDEIERVDRRLAETDSEIDRRKARRETLEGKRAALTDEIAALESAVEDLERADYSDVLAVHREVNELEFELEQLEGERADLDAEIEELEAELDRRESLAAQREQLTEELEERRTRIDRLEETAVESFNEHMEAVLDVLAYDNVERIWIERVDREVREGRRKVTRSGFELHIVRSNDEGVVYEDTVDHLSESEREVTGLVFALAGYLVHEVYETVPFIVLDSLEAIDSARIAKLVEYLAEHAEYLVVALLEEDAQALDDDYPRISEI